MVNWELFLVRQRDEVMVIPLQTSGMCDARE